MTMAWSAESINACLASIGDQSLVTSDGNVTVIRFWNCNLQSMAESPGSHDSDTLHAMLINLQAL